MTKNSPILITGAAGEVGGVSRMTVEMLLREGHPVRAFVRRDDERARSLREAGADVFVGDLLNIADVAAALAGCRRIYFSMSLSPYYTDAVSLMAAAARAQRDVEVFVNISDFEQSYMTFEKMTAATEERRAWLGGRVADWSPQQRAHWIAEQTLRWSGLPVVQVRATIFVENPILTGLALRPLSNGELRLPFGRQRLAPIAGCDVAELCARVLVDPEPHVSKAYELTGAELKDMHGFADDYGLVLGREVTYVAEDLDAWNTEYVDSVLAERPHVAEHLKTLTGLVAGGRYDIVTDQLEALLGRRPTTVRAALQSNPRLRELALAE